MINDSTKLSLCTNLCQEMNNGLFEQPINETLLSNTDRKFRFLFHTKSIIHTIAYFEAFLYKTQKGSTYEFIAEMFHDILSLAILCGIDPNDIGFEEMFIVNVRSFLDNNIKPTGILTYLFHATVASEDAIGWDLDQGEVDWQQVRDELNEVFYSFSALCLKCGMDFNNVMINYAGNFS